MNYSTILQKTLNKFIKIKYLLNIFFPYKFLCTKSSCKCFHFHISSDEFIKSYFLLGSLSYSTSLYKCHHHTNHALMMNEYMCFLCTYMWCIYKETHKREVLSRWCKHIIYAIRYDERKWWKIYTTVFQHTSVYIKDELD